MSKPVNVETLYAKFGPTIYARCKRLLKDGTAAEDATQDVFMKVLKHIDSAPGEEAVLPWIHRITTNHCLNVIRDSKRHAEPVEHVPELVDDEFEDSVVTSYFFTRGGGAAPGVRTPLGTDHVARLRQTVPVSSARAVVASRQSRAIERTAGPTRVTPERFPAEAPRAARCAPWPSTCARATPAR